MNFWKVLRWVGAILFIAIVLIAGLSLGTDHDTAGAHGANNPPPAPDFH